MKLRSLFIIAIMEMAAQTGRLHAGFSADWVAQLSSDGSTNYIPVDVDPGDQAYTLTLTDALCAGSVSPCFLLDPFTGFVSLKRHNTAGVRTLAKTYFPSGSGIRSRRDLVFEPVGGKVWMAINQENPVRQSVYVVTDALGNSLTEWADPVLSKEVTDLAVGLGGAVFSAASYGTPGLVLDKYSAPGVLDWSTSWDLGLGGGKHDCAVAPTADGGAFGAALNYSSSTLYMARYDGSGGLKWTVTMSGTGYNEVLGAAVDASDNAYVASGVSGTGRMECQVVKVDAAGSAVTLARWSADPVSSSVYTVKLLPGGHLLVGGKAGVRPYLAELDASGALVGEWRGDFGATTGKVQAIGVRSDGEIYATVWMGNIMDIGTYKNLLLGLSLGTGGTDVIPGWGPTPTPTATPTSVVSLSPSPTQTQTVPSATPSPEVPTATCTATPTASPSATVTTPPTWVQTATLTCTATPTLTPVPSTVATATSTPTSTVPPVATAVPPADCKPAVERVQVVPCPVLDAKGGRIKVRLGACVPGTLKVTVYTTAGAAVATLNIDVAGLGAGWNDIAIPPHSYTPGLYYFKVTASANGSSSESTGSCMVLR